MLTLQNKVIKYETMARKRGVDAAEAQRRADRERERGAVRETEPRRHPWMAGIA